MAKLTVATRDGGEIAERALDKDVVTLGRVMGNDIVLPDADKRVSSKHARVERGGRSWRLVDLGSAGGTFLNGERLDTQSPAPLRDGDSIDIGPFRIRFSREEAVDVLSKASPDALRAALRTALESLPPEARRRVLERLR